MFDILFARVFAIIGAMLIITGVSARLNKSASQSWGVIIMTFILLFAVMIFANSFPINLFLVGAFSAAVGWMISPTIQSFGQNYKIKQFMKERGIVLKKGEQMNKEQLMDLADYINSHPSDDQWNKIVFQAMLSTALAVLATSTLVFVSDIDFSFMGIFLFIALLILIIVSLLNAFIFKSKMISLIKAYFGVLIFTGYLIYDFNTLEKYAGDETWGTAINIAVNIYLDIINLFLYLLEILSEG